MTNPTAFVEINKLTSDRLDDTLHVGYAWDTDPESFKAFYEAKERWG